MLQLLRFRKKRARCVETNAGRSGGVNCTEADALGAGQTGCNSGSEQE